MEGTPVAAFVSARRAAFSAFFCSLSCFAVSLGPSAAVEARGCGFASLAGLDSLAGFESLDFRSLGFESLIGLWAGATAGVAAGEVVGFGAGVGGMERAAGVIFLSAIMAGGLGGVC